MNERWLIPSFTASSSDSFGTDSARRAYPARQADQAGHRANRADRRAARGSTKKD